MRAEASSGEVARTVTLDRGSEFAAAYELQEALGAPVYFCLPAPPVAEGDRREHQRAPRGAPPEGHGPVDRQRRGGPEGVRWPQPQAAQALRLEVPLGGIPRRGVALALTIRTPLAFTISILPGAKIRVFPAQNAKSFECGPLELPVGSSIGEHPYVTAMQWQFADLRFIRPSTALYSGYPRKTVAQPSIHAIATPGGSQLSFGGAAFSKNPSETWGQGIC